MFGFIFDKLNVFVSETFHVNDWKNCLVNCLIGPITAISQTGTNQTPKTDLSVLKICVYTNWVKRKHWQLAYYFKAHVTDNVDYNIGNLYKPHAIYEI